MSTRIFERTPAAQLIFLARDAIGVTSDLALAKRIEVADSQLSGWKKGRLDMPDHRTLQLAKLAGADHATWLVIIAADRAKHTDVREAWREVAARLLKATGEGDGR